MSGGDVIVYDRLVNPIFLGYARPDAELIYVGKGNFIIGIPARDLEADEISKYGGEKALLATKLYIKEKIQPEKSPVKDGE